MRISLENLVSLRVWGFALLTGALVGVLVGIAFPGAVATVGLVVMLLTVAAFVCSGEVLYCPACRKRVKVGASACGHCGRSV